MAAANDGEGVSQLRAAEDDGGEVDTPSEPCLLRAPALSSPEKA